MKRLVLAALLMSGSLASAAKVTVEDCDGYTSNNLRGQCYIQLLAQEDARLNRVYQDLLLTVDGRTGSQIREAQRLWISFRDEDCQSRRRILGLDARDTLASVCPAVKTQARADELQELLSIAEERLDASTEQ